MRQLKDTFIMLAVVALVFSVQSETSAASKTKAKKAQKTSQITPEPQEITDPILKEKVKNASAGDSDAMYQLAVAYATGTSVKLDSARALYLYEKSARMGNQQSLYTLQNIYTPKDCNKLGNIWPTGKHRTKPLPSYSTENLIEGGNLSQRLDKDFGNINSVRAFLGLPEGNSGWLAITQTWENGVRLTLTDEDVYIVRQLLSIPAHGGTSIDYLNASEKQWPLRINHVLNLIIDAEKKGFKPDGEANKQIYQAFVESIFTVNPNPYKIFKVVDAAKVHFRKMHIHAENMCALTSGSK